MSLTFRPSHSLGEIINFLASEYKADTGIPVHLFSAVNTSFPEFHGCLGITDNAGGTLFMRGKTMTAYGANDPSGLLKTLRRVGVRMHFED